MLHNTFLSRNLIYLEMSIDVSSQVIIIIIKSRAISIALQLAYSYYYANHEQCSGAI